MKPERAEDRTALDRGASLSGNTVVTKRKPLSEEDIEQMYRTLGLWHEHQREKFRELERLGKDYQPLLPRDGSKFSNRTVARKTGE